MNWIRNKWNRVKKHGSERFCRERYIKIKIHIWRDAMGQRPPGKEVQ